VMEYIPPFSFDFDSDGNIIKDASKVNHPMIMLAFKQPGYIYVDETQRGCSPDIATTRIRDYRDLVSKYELELVAGNFIQVPWSGFYTQKMMCWVTKCIKEPLPKPIPGVNDLEECQSRTDIQGVYVDGPVLSKVKEYAKYRSLLSLDSVTHQIKSLYPTYSTGRIADFTSLRGSYGNVPIRTNNQATTLEGVVAATFLEYPNRNATSDLFANANELIPAIPKLFGGGSMAGALRMVLSQPYDQDFDFMTVLDKPGMVMELVIAEIKEGRLDEFYALREKVIAKTRSSRHIKSMNKFEIKRDIVPEDDPLYYDNTNTEMDILVYDSLAAREANFQQLSREDPELFQSFFDTFTCIVCSLLTAELPSPYYPPYP